MNAIEAKINQCFAATAQIEMFAANLQFEQAAELRDIIQDIKSKQ